MTKRNGQIWEIGDPPHCVVLVVENLPPIPNTRDPRHRCVVLSTMTPTYSPGDTDVWRETKPWEHHYAFKRLA